MRFKFQGGWAPSDHNAQRWGAEMEGWPSLPLVRILKVMTGSRLKKSTESVVSRNGSPTKHLSRHRKWTGAQIGERRAGVLPPSASARCAQHCVSRFTAVETVSVSFLCFILCAWGCVCALNIYWMSEGSALYLRNLMRLGEGFYALHFIDKWVGLRGMGGGVLGGRRRPNSLPVSYS